MNIGSFVYLFLNLFITYFISSSSLANIVFVRSVFWLLVTSNVVPSSPIHVTLMMNAIRPSETSVLTRTTRRHISEDGILHCHRRENLTSYIYCFVSTSSFGSIVRNIIL
jgi:hypothetical protein